MDQLTLISGLYDVELAHVLTRLEQPLLIDERGDVEVLFGKLLSASAAPRVQTLDLIGSTTPQGLVQLGSWVIDGQRASTLAFFRELADHEVLVRLGIQSVRLLGCRSATSEAARSTIEALSTILGIEVYGTTSLLHAAHFDARGFRSDEQHLLTCASDLRHGVPDQISPVGDKDPRFFDLDALPVASHLPASHVPVPPTALRGIVELVERTSGMRMPGLLALPSHVLALPGPAPSSTRQLDVLLDASWVRTGLDADSSSGVMYPVSDPARLRELLATLAAPVPTARAR